MKPTYSNFEAKKPSGFLTLPPAGCYVARILAARVAETFGRQTIELMMDIEEGEYKGRYQEIFKDQKERFGDNAKYKGIFRLTPPVDGDEEWRRSAFENNLWCVQESNPGYKWDWEEQRLPGKLVGINVRNRLYTYNDQDRATTEICRFETVADVRSGKVKPLKDRDSRTAKDNPASDGKTFTEVSGNTVDVPW